MLYALFTQFIARYDLPALAIATVALIVSIRLAWQRRLSMRTTTAAAGP
jgi:hypothetical protein